MQVAKWGNSLAIRLPADLVRKLDLKAGDEIDIRPDARGLTVLHRPSPDEVLSALLQFRGRLKREDRLTRDDAHER
jgi:Growth regulator